MSTQFGDGGVPGFRAAEPDAPADRTTVWQRAQHGWPVRYPLVQFPNAPLLVALAGLLVSVVATGALQDYARATFLATLAVWAWLELTDGANWPRRVLGAAALVFVVVQIARALGA